MNEKNMYKIGYRIRLTKNREEVSNFLSSQILDIPDKKHILIACPMSQGKYIAFKKGKVLSISYILENIGNFIFDAKVVAYIKEDPLLMMKLELVNEVEKIQIRDFFRINISNDIEIYKKLKNEKEKTTDIVKLEDAKTLDISGGGMKIEMNGDYAKNQLIKIHLKVDNFEENFDARIIRVGINEKSKYKYVASLKFEKLETKSRDKLIQYLFQCERNQRLKDQKVNEDYKK